MNPVIRQMKIAKARELEAEAARLRKEVEDSREDDFDCDVTYTALAPAQADVWEASCPCGFRTKGTKEQCRQRAKGHPPRTVE